MKLNPFRRCADCGCPWIFHGWLVWGWDFVERW